MRLPSGAGHDAQMLARVCPAGMVFVPSVGGISHNVTEHTEPADLAAGADVLLQVLVALAEEGSGIVTRIVTVGAAQLGPIQRDAHPQGRRRAPARPAAPGPRRTGATSSCSPSWPSPPSSPAGSSTTAPRSTTATSGRCRTPTPSRCSTRPGGSASASASATPSSPPDGHRYNSQMLVERDGRIVATYRKVHIPGHEEHEPDRPFQHAERYYFEPGPDGFGVWRAFGGIVGMMICNDRRWPETLPGDGPAGRRADPVRLQHADPLRARPEPGHPAGLPQRPGHAGRRLPERHVGGRRGQGRRRGGRRLARRRAASSPRRARSSPRPSPPATS